MRKQRKFGFIALNCGRKKEHPVVQPLQDARAVKHVPTGEPRVDDGL